LTEQSPAGARAVAQAIRNSVSLLEQFPSGGRALRQRPNVRVIPTPRFPILIFYTTEADELLISATLPARRWQWTISSKDGLSTCETHCLAAFAR
jgi:plasmid stabilization system protein ParE